MKPTCPNCGADISNACASFGGKARARKLTSKRRKEIAMLGVEARLKKIKKIN